MYICDSPLDGIIGVAFDALNSAVEIPSPDFDVLNLWNQSCESDDPSQKSVGTCSTANMKTKILPSPIEQTLKEDTASGSISTGVFGLYCDYAATFGSTVDTIVPSLGIFFGGDMALNNIFYNSGIQAFVTFIDTLMYYVLFSDNIYFIGRFVAKMIQQDVLVLAQVEIYSYSRDEYDSLALISVNVTVILRTASLIQETARLDFHCPKADVMY